MHKVSSPGNQYLRNMDVPKLKSDIEKHLVEGLSVGKIARLIKVDPNKIRKVIKGTPLEEISRLNGKKAMYAGNMK